MPPLPGDLIGPQESFHVVAKAFGYPQHSLEVLLSRPSGSPALMRSSCDLRDRGGSRHLHHRLDHLPDECRFGDLPLRRDGL